MVEILGWIANFMFLGGGLCKSPRITLAIYSVGNLMFAIMYYCLDLYIAAFSVAIIICRSILSSTLNDEQNKIAVMTLTAVASLIVVATIDHSADIYVLMAGLSTGLSCYLRNYYATFRLLVCQTQLLWIAYGMIFDLSSVIVSAIVVLLANLWTFSRLVQDGSIQEEWNLLFGKRIKIRAKIWLKE